ncbi:MAG: SMP-30/gluconolactonase/LRE family protein [Opitutales bacterium]
MSTDTPRLVCRGQGQPAEGPTWWAERKLLVWVDIGHCLVNLFNPQSGENREITLPCPVGTAVPTTGNNLVCATRDGFMRLDVDTNEITPLTDPEGDQPDNRFNDGKAGPDGRLYAGTMAKNAGGAFYVLERDAQTYRKLFDGVTCSNGLAWSADERLFYYIDTPTGRVDVFAFDKENGTLSNRRTCFEIPKDKGHPDGMCIDDEGMLWVALWSGWGVRRYHPGTGEELAFIELPAQNVTCPAFGGSDFKTLYISTALAPESEREKQPESGGIFAVDLEVSGPAPFLFDG